MISREDRLALTKLKRTLEIFRAFDPELPIAAVLVFIMIALETDQTLESMGSELKSSTTTPCRYIQRLGMVDRKKQPGLGLVAVRSSYLDSRRKVRALTAAGWILVSEALDEFNRAAKTSNAH